MNGSHEQEVDVIRVTVAVRRSTGNAGAGISPYESSPDVNRHLVSDLLGYNPRSV